MHGSTHGLRIGEGREGGEGEPLHACSKVHISGSDVSLHEREKREGFRRGSGRESKKERV